MTNLHKTSTALLLSAALLLSGCAEQEPASAPETVTIFSTGSSNDSSSMNSTSSYNSSSEPESEDPSQGATSSNSSSDLYDDPMFIKNQKYLDLKGEELIARFGWPYDAPIDIEGMTVQKELSLSGENEEIPPSEISNKFRWKVTCHYGYLAEVSENGGKYEYKKYKTGDKIGEVTVDKIETYFNNIEYIYDYFAGVDAWFNGEITLTGEIMVKPDNYIATQNVCFATGKTGEIQFYPDEESRKKLPVVNFPKPGVVNDNGHYPTHDELRICLGNVTDYSGIDFEGIPTDGTRVKVKIRIKNYYYRAIVFTQLPFFGFADLADGDIKVL